MATFFDGEGSQDRRVAVHLSGALVLSDEIGNTLARWPLDEVRRETAPAGGLRLSCISAHEDARLEIDDTALAARVAAACGRLDSRRPLGSTVRIFLWSLAAVASLVGVLWLGLPALARQIVPLIPPPAERALGDVADRQLQTMLSAAAGGDLSCASDPLHGEARAILDGLLHKLVPERPQLRLEVLRVPVANALALPGERIYILAPLLRQLNSGDELAAVIAHELGHVEERHGLHRLVEEAGLGFLFGYVIGDVSGGAAIALASRLLVSAAYSRDMERSADSHAARLLVAHDLPPRILGDALRNIAPQDSKISLLSYLQSHPMTEERIAELSALPGGESGVRLVAPDDWALLQRYCATTAVTSE